MKKLFYGGLAGLLAYEVLNVYFIMPLPGSQHLDTVGAAHFLHQYRWLFRAAFGVVVVLGAGAAFRPRRKWLPGAVLALAAAAVWFLNFQMAADRMFRQPAKLVLRHRPESAVPEDSLVIGIDHGGESKAYPIRYLVYHHQVQDTVGGQPVIVTYCSVCRTGCVFEPVVDGHLEKFRLVGMDHFNAMFEDETTHSWWRQATGEAVAGPRTGTALPVFPSSQVSLHEWLELHPDSLVMQPDPTALEGYDLKGRFERGESKGPLTRTDPGSWRDKSWVVGVRIGSVSKAYDWNRLKERRIINDQVGPVPVVVVLSRDGRSFAAFRRPAAWTFTVDDDVLSAGGQRFDFSGRSLGPPANPLEAVEAHQEFWHSWRTFYPGTLVDS
jgi:hypothetical protein